VLTNSVIGPGWPGRWRRSDEQPRGGSCRCRRATRIGDEHHGRVDALSVRGQVGDDLDLVADVRDVDRLVNLRVGRREDTGCATAVERLACDVLFDVEAESSKYVVRTGPWLTWAIVTVAPGETTTGICCVSVEAAHWAFAGDVAVTVMTAGPEPTAVTTPVVALTVAWDGADVPNVMTAGAQPAGWTMPRRTVAVSKPNVWPRASESVFGWTVSDVMPAGSAPTLTVTACVRLVVEKPVPEPVAVTVIVATPGPTAVTTPVVALTVATDGVLLA
jgi:hypothetical protein